MSHVTHDQAYDALCNPAVPLEEAARLFERAHRRSNEATRIFCVGTALNIRAHRIEQATGNQQQEAAA